MLSAKKSCNYRIQKEICWQQGYRGSIMEWWLTSTLLLYEKKCMCESVSAVLDISIVFIRSIFTTHPPWGKACESTALWEQALSMCFHMTDVILCLCVCV